MIVDVTNTIGRHKFKSEITAESLIEQMDRCGVDMAVVFCHAESLDNDSVEAAYRRYPDRFIGLYTANPWLSGCEESFREAVTKRGFRGLHLDPCRSGFMLNEHAAFYPLLNVCRELDVPVWCYGAAEVFCNPILFEQVADDYPAVPIIMGLMGFQYDSSTAAGVAERHSNIYLETSASMQASLPRAFESAGVERVLLGSGTPYMGYMDLEIAKVKSELNSDKAAGLVLGGNAARLFKVKGDGAV
jgi:predicted TIM-barrel fold metal-dependent hydrolase